MRITESQLRRIVREEINSVQRDKEKLIVQGDDVDELGGYDVDSPAIPGGMGSDDTGYDVGMVYEKESDTDDDFTAIRRARFKASGMSDRDAERKSRSALKHRGQRPGRG